MSVSAVVSKLKAVSKVIVAAVGLVASALVKYTDLVPAQYQGYATAFIALATLIGAYHAPYAPLGAKRRAQRKQARKTVPPAHQAD
jgi:hypothetical protein